jgi:hypothetical protein
MIWDGARLLLLPPESGTDFQVIDADVERLRVLVLGPVVPLDDTSVETV